MAAHPQPPMLASGSGKRSASAKPRSGLRTERVRPVLRAPVPASKAKAHLLQLLDQVERERTPITITKRGRAVAQIVPAPPESKVSAFNQMFGRTSGWMKITGDIVSPDHDGWGPDWQ